MSSSTPLIPDTAPFSSEQRAWLNGFFGGLYSRRPGTSSSVSSASASAASPLVPLTLLYGSQTGTAEGLAKRAAKEAGKRGFAATVLDMAQTEVAALAGQKNLLIITSTYGDGEPPDNAKALHAQLAASDTRLPDLRFSICALGDTNYNLFCQCGRDFDAFLEKVGATRVATCVECDLDYEANFTTWLDAALTALKSRTAPPVLSAVAQTAPETQTEVTVGPGSSQFSRKNPFLARVLASRNLNGTGSAKAVHHVELDLGNSALTYAAGDALGVVPHNCPELVADVLAALGCDGEEAVQAPDTTTTSLRRALTEIYDLGKPSAELVSLLTPAIVAPIADSSSNAATLHVINLLLACADMKLSPSVFVRALKKIQPRLYSISSSPLAHGNQVHLTVGAVRYQLNNRPRKGVCSTFLADRVVPGESRVGIFVHPNTSFRPPMLGDTPMIMVGPGTGIAPFRAFLHERKAAGAKGKNWLFFGDQCTATDFLYRDELRVLMQDGVLTRLETAFSRDQPQKIYVQDRMLEHAAELYTWLEQGAHFYVCGDATRMAKDVDAALHTVIQRAGGKTQEQAAAYVQLLKAEKRYCRDVY